MKLSWDMEHWKIKREKRGLKGETEIVRLEEFIRGIERLRPLVGPSRHKS
jgi:hypothetical protein